jgi:hypothetical protein
MFDIPSKLQEVEFSLVHFQLEFQESYRVTQEALIRLRRDLHHAARYALSSLDGESLPKGSRFTALFDPPLTANPVALRRHQRPGPPFVVFPVPGLPRDYEPGDSIDLTVVFWGRGIHRLGDFSRVLQALGSLGIHRGEGLFELGAIDAEDPAGNRVRIWQEDQDFECLAPPISDARWWLETSALAVPSLRLEFVSPARLLSGGKPLFRANFVRFFPFILRRVTSMIFGHCDLEVLGMSEPGLLLEAASRVVEQENQLVWRDWRVLEGKERIQDIGGVSGSVRLEGEALAEILWVLNLGSLLNIGKGAAFCAGHYLLKEA